MPGNSAYLPIDEIAKPKPGEVAFVSGAAGAVGSTAVQILKANGLKVIGCAGGEAKCKYLTEIGCDETIDYKKDNVHEKL